MEWHSVRSHKFRYEWFQPLTYRGYPGVEVISLRTGNLVASFRRARFNRTTRPT